MKEGYIEMIGATFGGIASWYFGGIDGVIKVLIAMCITDYLTGIAAAYRCHDLSSREGFTGIFRKVAMFMLVGMVHVIEQEILDGGTLLRDAICCFYIGTEGISFVENACDLGLPVPDWVKKRLRSFTEDKE